MKKIEQYVAINGMNFETEEECKAYEKSLDKKIIEEFFKISKKVEEQYGQWLGLPYWTDEHTVCVVKPKSESDICFLNLMVDIYNDCSVHNKYSNVWSGSANITSATVFGSDDINKTFLFEIGYGGSYDEDYLLEGDFLQIWKYEDLLRKLTKGILTVTELEAQI